MTTEKRSRIGQKLYTFIAAMVILISAVLILFSYIVHQGRIDSLFKEKTVQDAKAVAVSVDSDVVERLRDLWRTDEYQVVQQKAEETEDEAAVLSFVETKGMAEDMNQLESQLLSLQKEMDILYLYLLSVDGKTSVSILDPSEPSYAQGKILANENAFGEEVGNQEIPPTITNGEYGWLCSAYEPVYNDKGEAIAVVGVDIDMNEIMKERHRFLFAMIAFGLIMTVITAILGGFLMRIVVVRPVESLTDEMKNFKATDEGYEAAHITTLDINSHDEIEALYQGIRQMQINTVDYLQNLSRITAEKNRIGAELNVATQIQADMLPRIFPAFPERTEFDLYATMTPAKEVGGDFYDFFLVDDDHLALVMADVSGKGVPAALFMVIAKTLIKNRAQMGGTPSEVLSFVNDQLCEGNDAELFVTVWLGIIEISTGKGLAANAGHEHPVLRRADGEYELVIYRHSPAVATMEGIRFKEHEFQLNAGDRLFIYTDGVAEATNAHDELFGTDRMLDALNASPETSAEETLRRVKSSVDEFVGEAPQFDDITMLGLTYFGAQKA